MTQAEAFLEKLIQTATRSVQEKIKADPGFPFHAATARDYHHNEEIIVIAEFVQSPKSFGTNIRIRFKIGPISNRLGEWPKVISRKALLKHLTDTAKF